MTNHDNGTTEPFLSKDIVFAFLVTTGSFESLRSKVRKEEHGTT